MTSDDYSTATAQEQINYSELMSKYKRRAIHMWELRYKKGMKLKDVAEIYKVTPGRVNQILNSSLIEKEVKI